MADKTDNNEARLTTEPCGELGLWIKFDGQVIDLIYLSELQEMISLKQETVDAIEQIYDDYRPEDDEE